MASQTGRVLSAAESLEFERYGNLGLTLPDKFARVVTDATDVRGRIYRFPDADEQKAADEAAKAAADAAAADARLTEKVKAEVAKRATEVVVPPKPDADPTVAR